MSPSTRPQSHTAFQEAIGSDTIAVARATGLSKSLIGKWKESTEDFTDSGAYNPLDRIKTICDTIDRIDPDSGRADAPLRWLAAERGYTLIRLPKAPASVSLLTDELIKAVKEFGDLASESGAALADGRITRREYRAIEKEAQEIQAQIAQFLAAAQKAVE